MAIYLDFNASTPVAPEVAARMAAVLHEPFGNPSSDHWAGMSARAAVETARAQVAALLGCDAGEVIFTSGGSEANNHAIKGAFFATRVAHPHIITTEVEHPAVVGPCRFLEGLGAKVVGKVRTWVVMEAPTGQRFCVIRAQTADFEAKAVTWED